MGYGYLRWALLALSSSLLYLGLLLEGWGEVGLLLVAISATVGGGVMKGH